MLENCCSEKTNKMLTLFILILVIFFIFLTISTIADISNKIKQGRYIGSDAAAKNTISVSDTGEVYVKPDLGIVSFTVKNESQTVAQAMAENSKKMNAVNEAVKKEGVEAKDLKTTNFNIYPRYDYPRDGQRILGGYEVTQSLEVKIRNLEKIGQIIEKATSAGANQLGDLNFIIDKEDEFKNQAREQAIKKAKAKAQSLAQQLGIKLLKINSFNENFYMPFYYSDYKMESMGIGGGGSVAPQIETGENKIAVTVNIIYEID